jgi:hypothetical protein
MFVVKGLQRSAQKFASAAAKRQRQQGKQAQQGLN